MTSWLQHLNMHFQWSCFEICIVQNATQTIFLNTFSYEYTYLFIYIDGSMNNL